MEAVTPTYLAAAALLARSNCGMPAADINTVRFMLAIPKPTLSNMVLTCCEEFMENDDHNKMFQDEAKSWLKRLQEDGLERARVIWPHIFAYLL